MLLVSFRWRDSLVILPHKVKGFLELSLDAFIEDQVPYVDDRVEGHAENENEALNVNRVDKQSQTADYRKIPEGFRHHAALHAL